MARRGFLRTPEGAWYQGYAGLKPRYYNVHHGYADPPIEVYGVRGSGCYNDAHEKEAASLYYLSERDRARELEAAMYYEGGNGSYRASQRYPDGKRLSWDKGREGRDDAAEYNARPYGDAASTTHHRGGQGMNLPLYDPKSFPARNGPDFKLYDTGPRPSPPPPPPHSPVGDFKYYDPPPRNGPLADLKAYDGDPPARHSPVGDFKYYDPPPRNGVHPADIKMYDPSPRNYDPPADFQHHDSSPRNGPADGGRRYEVSKYPPPEREWDPTGRVSPRRMVHYEPSFHDPGSSPRNVPPWERPDRGHPHGYATEGQGHGQGRWDLQGQGQGQMPDPLRGGQGATQMAPTSKKAGSAFLFIRFHGDSVRIIEQACQSALTKDLKGRFVGIADKGYDFPEIPEKKNHGYAVFQFPSLQDAETFYNRDRKFRLNHFPAPFWETEIFALQLHIDPGSTNLFRTFLLCEVSLNPDGPVEESLMEYRETYAEPFARLLRDNGAVPFAAFCARDSRLVLKRRCFERKDVVVLHLFRDQRHYHDIWNLKKYEELREKHNSLAREKCSLFTVRADFYH